METPRWTQPSRPFIREDQQDGAGGQLGLNPTPCYHQNVSTNPAVQQTQGGQYLSHSRSYSTGQPSCHNALNRQVTTSLGKCNANIADRHSLLRNLLMDKTNSQTISVDAHHGNPPLHGNDNLAFQHRKNFIAQTMDIQGTSQNSPPAINAHQTVNANQQRATHGVQHLGHSRVDETFHGIHGALTLANGTNQGYIQHGVLIQQDSNRIAQPQFNPSGYNCTLNYGQNPNERHCAQTLSPVTSTASPMSFTTNIQRTCLPQNQSTSSGSGMREDRHGVSHGTHPSILPNQLFNTNNNKLQVVPSQNTSGRQALPMLIMNQQSQPFSGNNQLSTMLGGQSQSMQSMNQHTLYVPTSCIPSQCRTGLYNASLHVQTVGNNVGLQHTYNPQMPPTDRNSTPNQPCTENSVQSFVIQNERFFRNVQFGNTGQNEVALSNPTRWPALQQGSNQNSSLEKCNTNSSIDLISNTGANIYCHAPGQLTTHCATPPQPEKQGFYKTATEDQNRNGFKAHHLIFVGNKQREDNQGQQGQRPGTNDSLTMNVSYEMFSQKNMNAQKPSAPVFSAPHGQKAIAVVQPLSTPQQVMTLDTLTSKTVSTPVGAPPKIIQWTSTKTDNDAISNARKVSHDTSPAISYKIWQEDCVGLGSTSSVTATTNKTVEVSPTVESLNQLFSNLKDKPALTPTQEKNQVDREVPVMNHEETLETGRPEILANDMVELSSVPVIQWTIDKLTALQRSCKDFSEKENYIEKDVTSTILNHYWDGNDQKMSYLMNSDNYKNFIEELTDVACKLEKSPGTIIFSQILGKPLCTLKNVHVLEHNAVFPKMMHKSCWLNTNEELDEIDKEYGFPWCLKNYQPQPDLKGRKDNRAEEKESEQPASVMQVKERPQQESLPPRPDSTNANEIQRSCQTHCSTQTISPVKMDSSEDYKLNDPLLSVEIHVLTPDEAKRFFEGAQVHCEERVNQKKEDSLQDGFVGDELPEEMCVDLTELKSENKVDDQMENYCCILKLGAKMHGLNSACPCQCEPELGPGRTCFNANLVEMESSVQNDNINTLVDRRRDVNYAEVNPATLISTETEQQCVVLDMDEHCETQDSESSCFLLGSPVMDLTIDSSDDVVGNDLSSECKDAVFVVTLMTEESEQKLGPSKTFSGNSCDLKLPVTQKVSPKEKHDQSPTPEGIWEDKGRRKKGRRKRKQFVKGFHSQSVPIRQRKIWRSLKSSSNSVRRTNLIVNCIDTSVNGKIESKNEFEPVKSNATKVQQPVNSSQKLRGHGHVNNSLRMKTVALALFGSSPQKKHGIGPTDQSKDRHCKVIKTNPFSYRTLVPPSILNVVVNSRALNSRLLLENPESGTPEAGGPVKERLFKDWQNSFVPIKRKKSRQGRPPKGMKRCIMDIKEAQQASTLKTDQTRIEVSKGRPTAGSGGARQSMVSEKKAILNGLKLRVQKSKINAALFNRPEEIKSKNDNPVFMLAQKRNSVGFSVLTNTFVFK